MSKISGAREKRRDIILRGISQGLKHSEIATQLGVNRWVIMSDIRFMHNIRDPELEQAQKAQEKFLAEKHSVFPNEKKYAKQNKRFLSMTGMTLQEKTFRNMIDFYKPELIKILVSRDQNTAIMKLPKSIRRTLIHNGIIIKAWHNREIAPHARKYLNKK